MEIPSTQKRELEEEDINVTASPRLCAILRSLSLEEYTDALLDHGFTSWDQLLDIQERDLEALKFKLGHRRKLQREIAICKDITRLQNQLERPKDTTEPAAISRPSSRRPEKRRIDDVEHFHGMHKRSRQMTLHSLLSADPTTLSSTTHFTVMKDHCSTISLRMTEMYGHIPRPRSISSSPTVTPRPFTGDVGLSLRSSSDLHSSTPTTEQADAWACSLLNLSPGLTLCGHTDDTCACWEDTSLLRSHAPQANGNPSILKAFTESSGSSSQSDSLQSTNYEQSSEICTRATSCASVQDVERSMHKPIGMASQPQPPSQASQPLPQSVTCIYILPKMVDANYRDNLHFAVYLKFPTLNDFIQLVANKCGMLSNQILHTVRVAEQGVEVAFTDKMVSEIMNEQAIIAEFRDIGLPPGLHPSDADAAGFGELKSRFFELRLRY